MKKFFALVLAIMMVMSLALPAAAADDTTQVTFTHIKGNHTFTAYQIFDGTLSGSVLSDIVWGANVKDGNALINALKADTTALQTAPDSTGKVETYTLANEFKNVTTAEEVAAVMKLWSSDSIRLDRFAEVIGKKDTNGAYLYLSTDNVKVSDQGSLNSETGRYTYTISQLDPGYYLIMDTTSAVNGEDFRTKYMLQITRDTDIRTKGSYSTVVKEVYDTADQKWGEHASQHIGKEVEYQWEVNLDSELDWYDKYYLQFTDTLPAGLHFDRFTDVYFIQNDGSRVYLKKDSGEWEFKVYDKNGNDITSNYEGTIPATVEEPVITYMTADGTTKIDSTNKTASNKKLTMTWNDIKTVFPDVDGDHSFVVEYVAVVTDAVTYGVAGNDNDVYIEFSNSPSDNQHGQSVPDDASEFNFQMQIVKVDSDDTSKTLAGAVFYLYHKHGTVNHYAVVNDEGEIIDWVQDTERSIQTEIDAIKARYDEGEQLSSEDAQKVSALEEKLKDRTQYGTKLTTHANGLIDVKGLSDAVTYYLHELVAPEGYNKITTDVSIEINPVYAADGNTYTELRFSVDGASHTVVDDPNNPDDNFTIGKIPVEVKNDAGTTLPTTGGMGTTLFYVIGSILVIGALVMLITKKRMAAEN